MDDYLTEEKLIAETKKTSEEWDKILDKVDVEEKGHNSTAKFLQKEYGISHWWSQIIATRYEYKKGVKRKNEQ